MNKKILSFIAAATLLASIAAPTPLFAHGDEAPTDNTAARDPDTHMQEMRTVLHEATFETENIQYGITTSVTSDDHDVFDAIQNELLAHETDIGTEFDEFTVSSEELDNGAAFTFQSQNEDGVAYLQRNGNYILEGFLMGQMMELMQEDGSDWNMMTEDDGMMSSTTTSTNWWNDGNSMMGFGGMGFWWIFAVLLILIGAILFSKKK